MSHAEHGSEGSLHIIQLAEEGAKKTVTEPVVFSIFLLLIPFFAALDIPLAEPSRGH